MNVIQSRILDLATAGTSPDEILEIIRSKNERSRLPEEGWNTLKRRVTRRGYIATATAVGAYAFWKRTEADLVRIINARLSSPKVDTDTRFCLHDVLDPVNIDEWTALLDVDPNLPPARKTHDPLPFLRVLDMAIREGRISGEDWEQPMVWRSRMRAAMEEWHQVLGTLAFELMRGKEYIESTRIVLVEIGSALPVFAHFLFPPASAGIGKPRLEWVLRSEEILALSMATNSLHESRLVTTIPQPTSGDSTQQTRPDLSASSTSSGQFSNVDEEGVSTDVAVSYSIVIVTSCTIPTIWPSTKREQIIPTPHEASRAEMLCARSLLRKDSRLHQRRLRPRLRSSRNRRRYAIQLLVPKSLRGPSRHLRADPHRQPRRSPEDRIILLYGTQRSIQSHHALRTNSAHRRYRRCSVKETWIGDTLHRLEQDSTAAGKFSIVKVSIAQN